LMPAPLMSRAARSSYLDVSLFTLLAAGTLYSLTC
jgi:hypothetical protein